MLRICHIISGDLWAGAEVMSYYLLKDLVRYADLDIIVVLLNRTRLYKELQELGIQVHLVDENAMPFVVSLMTIRKLLRHYRPDIVQSHRYKENIIAHLASRPLKGIRLIATQHGLPELHSGLGGLKYRLVMKYNFHILLRRFKKVISVSEDIGKTFVELFNFPEGKIQVIHNGIALPDKMTDGKNDPCFIVGSCGRFFPVKDYPFMVQVAKETVGKIKPIHFEIAGDGPEMATVAALIARYGLNENFKLRGHMDDISTFYQGLSLYLNTSVHEGIPMSVLEAMAYGIPVIAPKQGGIREIVDDGVQGFLLEKRDPKDFAKMCLLLFKDTALRNKMSHAAREKVVQVFSVKKMTRQYYDLYLELAG